MDLRGKQHQQHYRVIGESRVAGTLHDKEMVKGNRDPPNIKLKRVLNLKYNKNVDIQECLKR